LPIGLLTKRDQRIGICGTTTATAAQLVPGGDLSHGCHDFFQTTQLAVPMIQCDPVFARLQSAQHIGCGSEHYRLQKRHRNGLHAALHLDHTGRFRCPLGLRMRQMRRQRRGKCLFEVKQVISVR
jgi:hypothetical protein